VFAGKKKVAYPKVMIVNHTLKKNEGYAMEKNTSNQPEKKEVITTDLLTEVLKQGAQELLTKAIEAEVSEFIKRYESLCDEEGHHFIVRNGYLPEREIQTGMGQVSVTMPRIRDKRKETDTKINFTSQILPPYLRRTKSGEELLPWLYLKGISTGDFPEALQALLGSDAPGLSFCVNISETLPTL
jgi:putative transposase